MSDICSDEHIKYIIDSVYELSINERKDILQILLDSNINNAFIQSKGDGTQIKFKHIPPPVILSIYNNIKNKLALKKIELINM